MTIEASITEAQRMLTKSAERNPGSLQDFMANLDPATVRTLRNSVIGSLLGGAAGVGAGAISPDKSMIGSGALGALLGGVAGGAGTAGYNMLTSKTRLPGETSGSGSLSDRLVVDPAAGLITSHPGAVAGTAAGGAWAWGRRPAISKALEIAENLDKTNLERFSAAAKARTLPAGAKMPASLARAVKMINNSKKLNPLTRQLALHRLAKNKQFYAKGLRSPLNLAAVPIGLTLGYMIDRYLKGRNR